MFHDNSKIIGVFNIWLQKFEGILAICLNNKQKIIIFLNSFFHLKKLSYIYDQIFHKLMCPNIIFQMLTYLINIKVYIILYNHIWNRK